MTTSLLLCAVAGVHLSTTWCCAAVRSQANRGGSVYVVLFGAHEVVHLLLPVFAVLVRTHAHGVQQRILWVLVAALRAGAHL